MVMVLPVPRKPMALDAASARYLRFARGGDVAEIDALLRDHLGRAYAQARRRLGNDSDAEDAVQEAVLQLIRGAQGYDGKVPFAACWARQVHIACGRLIVTKYSRRRVERKAGAIASRRMATPNKN